MPEHPSSLDSTSNLSTVTGPPRLTLPARSIGVLLWAYFLALLALLFIIRIEGERWWVATLLLFGPRWIYGLPLLVLIPAAAAIRPRTLWLAAVCALCFTFPILGLCVPWRTTFLERSDQPSIRILTCNIHRQMLDPTAMLRFIDANHPDVIVLEEWTSRDQAGVFRDPTWHLLRAGELMLGSRYPIVHVDDVANNRWAANGAGACYELLTPSGPIRILAIHLASPHIMFADALHRDLAAPASIEGNCQLRREQSKVFSDFAQNSVIPTVVAGDFNSPADSSILQTTWPGLTDAFSVAGLGIGNTYYAKWTSTRIDHILFSAGLQCTRCVVGPEMGSPHRPVLAQFQLAGSH